MTNPIYDKRGVPDYQIGAVDVRDVAAARMAAGLTPSAQDRPITSGHNANFPELAKILRVYFGDAYPFPKSILPKALIWLIGPFLEGNMTRKIIARNIGVSCGLDKTARAFAN